MAIWTTGTRATLHPGVVCTTLENRETVLLHLETRRYYTLNETGTLIWELLGQGLTAPEIGGKLAERFEVTEEDAEHYVLDLGRDLAAQELICAAAD